MASKNAVSSSEDVASPSAFKKRKRITETPVRKKKVKIKDVDSESSCNEETVENILEDMKEEIGNALEKSCFKNKLTPKNVKSILRHIIANEYVLTMVRSTMNPSEGAELSESKLTRSKAKEMRKQQCSLPWPVASPAKTVQKVSKKLLEEEFPDESSGDEDYKPEECPSEDEKASSVGTPRSSRASLPSSPVSKPYEAVSEDENALVIALPPDLEATTNCSEADKIALRTRSKLCLNDTPLEEIEASFVAPDITMDMYDAYCDDEDWQSFLVELYKPNDVSSTHDHHDDAENDPEYKATEEEVPDYEDLCYEQVTPDEWNDLMLGAYELAKEDLSFLDDEDDEVKVGLPENFSPSVNISLELLSVEHMPSIWMNSDERLQLQEQMRMYVQLLTQSHLLCHGNPALKNLHSFTKLLLEELKMFAVRERVSSSPSAFHSNNLDEALEIVKKYEDVNLPVSVAVPKTGKKHLPVIPPHIKKTLATSKVFIYPELLPTCGMNSILKYAAFFTTAEENLVALGLEMFQEYKNPVDYIHKYILPVKSVDRIKSRITNIKKRKTTANSVKYFFVHNQAPMFQRVMRIFDPDHIKPPEDYPPESLPKWMASFSKFPSMKQAIPVKVPKPKEPTRYVPILPRLFTPPIVAKPDLEQSPQKEPSAPSICDSETPYQPPAYLARKFYLNITQSDADKRRPDSDDENEEIELDSRGSMSSDSYMKDSESVCSSSHPRGLATIQDPDDNARTSGTEHEDSQQGIVVEFVGDLYNSNSERWIINEDPSGDGDLSGESKNQRGDGSKDDNSDMKRADFNENSNGEEDCGEVVNNVDDENDGELNPNEEDYSDNDEDEDSESDSDEESYEEEEDDDEMNPDENDCDEVDGENYSEINSNDDKDETDCGSQVVEKQSTDAVADIVSLEYTQQTPKKPRDLESSLSVLQASRQKETNKETMCANIYLLRATEMLKKDPEVYEKFLSTLCKYHRSMESPIDLYSELKVILKDYPILVDDFIVFLHPGQAKKCERYHEHVELSKLRTFFRKVELYFKDEPEHIKKIVRSFAQMQKQVNLKSAEAISAIRPLLKGQSKLLEELENLQLPS